MSAPRLSVVLMVDRQRERCAWALQSLLEQSIAAQMEIVLLDFAGADAPPVRGSDHPAVRRLRAEKSIGHGGALALGARAATAPLVGFVEEHVIVMEGWAEALVDAHGESWAAVSGEVHPGDLDRPVALRIELLSRHDWSAPARRSEVEILRWNSVCYKRERLLQLGDRLPEYLDAEPELFRLLRRDGGQLLLEPRARFVHAHESDWSGFLHGAFHTARMSAAASSTIAGGGVAKRARGIATNLVGFVRWPWVLWRRTRDLPERERWLRLFYANLPQVVVYFGYTTAGGIAGYLFGPGRSPQTFLEFELNAERVVPEVVRGGHGLDG